MSSVQLNKYVYYCTRVKQVKLRYNLYLVDFDKMRELLEQIEWEGPLDIHGAWQFVSISYCQARNELQNLTRSLRKTYEGSLAVKHFWKYVNSHLKVCLSISVMIILLPIRS